MANEEYIALNKANWDERAPEHAKAPGYCYQRLLKQSRYISDVVSFDIPLIGDLSGLEIVHLQCHIGTDTLSLARRGAKHVVGLDFSPGSLHEARKLASKAAGGDKLSFVEANTYDALSMLDPASFDMVFTGIGALCWLPSIKRWAETVSALLRPGGRLFIREGHPMLWTMNEKITSAPTVGFPYFERVEPFIVDDGGTYVETDHVFQTTRTMEWNHGLGEIIQALLDAGMALTGVVEHKSIPWCALPGQMEQMGSFGTPEAPHGNVDGQVSYSDIGEWVMKKDQDHLPLTYTLQAVKNS